MTRAVVMSWRNYQPYGKECYDPLWYGFLRNLKLWANEFDKLYILDSLWNFTQEDARQLSMVKDSFEFVTTDPSDRYYDAYKKFLPNVKEDLILFMDNDVVVYKPGKVDETFKWLGTPIGDDNRKPDVVSIYDTIGEKTDPRLNGKSKFCPYWFATKTEFLMKYRDCEWGPVPWGETLSELTFKMLDDGAKPFEWTEDKSNILIDGSKDGERGKDLGYYHIRAGSTPAYLLAELKYGNKQTFKDYLDHQPMSEYLRQCAWYQYLGGEPMPIWEEDITQGGWDSYMKDFIKYHGL